MWNIMEINILVYKAHLSMTNELVLYTFFSWYEKPAPNPHNKTRRGAVGGRGEYDDDSTLYYDQL